MACPFSSATDWIGESAATSTAVCSRTVIASSLAGNRVAATMAGPMPAEANWISPAASAWFSGAP